jgi:hypothetical protein
MLRQRTHESFNNKIPDKDASLSLPKNFRPLKNPNDQKSKNSTFTVHCTISKNFRNPVDEINYVMTKTSEKN